ncbi:hypothetical protein DPMN_153420 [Dreissena polymorpha]|uniref:DUF4455 domain-containing protein n=1 Tax=Dreissena polymorpha TaxID=45954 RepID=A0A9D4J895_DREPO|nr:hypothetical protein DPMN_153420 [Dreissena polymorpha]
MINQTVLSNRRAYGDLYVRLMSSDIERERAQNNVWRRRDCLQEIERIKLDLLDTGVCSESRAKSVVEEFMIPLVGERQGVYERNLETMERALEEQNKMSGEQLKSLFKFAQGAAHVWDVHEIGLARQERSLQEKLEQSKVSHDAADKEAHLDIIMDRMRQDATEKALKDSLTRALEMLDKIRHAYEVFHSDQENIVKQYPDMVKSELNNYDEALCKLFSLDRNKPSEQTREATQDSITPDDTIVEDGMVGKKKSKTPLQKPVKPEQTDVDADCISTFLFYNIGMYQ